MEMEKLSDIPVLEKTLLKRTDTIESSVCCAPKNEAGPCCAPSKTKEENGGACCQQPEDGTACCNK
jgi:hypothetical protein